MITLLNKFDDKYVIKEDDVLQIVLYYLKENNLDSILSDVKFDDDFKYMASYDLRNNKVILNNEKMWKYCYLKTDKVINDFKINSDYYTYFLNFYYIAIIFHELTHVLQKYNYEKTLSNNKLYVYLYELCRFLEYGDIASYNKNNNLFPMEIEANNEGLLKAYKLMSYTKLPTKENKIMYLEYLRKVLSNYKKINKFRVLTPLDKLANKDSRINLNEISELVDEVNLNRISRLNYGLDITSREYDIVNKEKQKILLR